MSVCCPPGSTGPKKQSKPAAELKGEMKLLGKINTYVVGSAANSNRAIVICEDIFGIESGRTKEIADRLAEETDSLVVLPELLMDDVWPESYGAPRPCNFPWFIPFLRRNNGDVTTKLFVDNIAGFLESQNATKWAWVGFCLGGCMGVCLAYDERFKCGVACHPAFQGFGLAGGKPMKDVMTAIKGDLLILPTKNDPPMAHPNGEVQRLVRDSAKRECLVEPYLDQVHGFVNRGDVSDNKVAPDLEKATKRVIEYISLKLQ